MRTSRFLLSTLRETPADAETVSHRLMLRAGLIRQLAAGIYNWLPPGLRVLRRVEAIVREEMDRSGAQEVLMPMVQPRELWEETGRWEKMGPELLRLSDRHEREFCLGPTHEEIITDLVRREVRSYRQLPANFYQIQTKFRDEVRPRFGVMRAREFIMKDAYSFHLDQACFDRTYQAMHDAYCRILERLGLSFRAVLADSGAIGGARSHEFQVLAESGEDVIAYSDDGPYAANLERAETVPSVAPRPAPGAALERLPTPGVATIADLCALLGTGPETTVKTLVVHGEEDLVALVVRGDHQLNEVKAAGLPGVAAPLRFAGEAEIRARLGVGPGSIGPVGLPVRGFVDHAAWALGAFAAGANVDGEHLVNIHWARDVDGDFRPADLRNVVDGDPSPDGHGTLRLRRGIEVGHIFQLGTVYSEPMAAALQDEDGTSRPLIMGCYGMGVTRLVAAIIEQCHDDAGILWPEAVAPFRLALVPLNQQKSEAVRTCAEDLYAACLEAGIDVLLDDRPERPGVKFADLELLGVPHRLVIGDRGLREDRLEYASRRGDRAEVPVADALAFLRDRLT